jgi:hypothetical protein
MTAEVEALLGRLDDISSRSGHEWNAAKDAAALIRAQVDEIARLRSEFNQISDGARCAMQERDRHIECLQDEIEKMREQIAAAARQEPVGIVGANQVIGYQLDLPAGTKLYAAPVPAGDGRPVCPDCYRFKARNADDCAAGDCSKWHAVRDQEAVRDCKQFHDKTGYYAKPSVPAGDAVSEQEESLHIAVCQAVTLINVGDWRQAHTILRESLIAYADAVMPKPATTGDAVRVLGYDADEAILACQRASERRTK